MDEKGRALVIEPLDSTMEVTTFQWVRAEGPAFRSCWECNGAHEHLKMCDWLVCFICEKEYRLGEEVGA